MKEKFNFSQNQFELKLITDSKKDCSIILRFSIGKFQIHLFKGDSIMLAAFKRVLSIPLYFRSQIRITVFLFIDLGSSNSASNEFWIKREALGMVLRIIP
ncbi:MAG TPA: hypothetical protein VK308_08385 [Pyrinomonadaceae bacterium]|nr:hypothetical protein [Pyrinomonadaceae bacterium]